MTADRVVLRLPPVRGAWEVLARQALFALLRSRAADYAEAVHTLPFPPEQGFRGPDTYHAGDVFQRALIGDALCDANELLEGQLDPVIRSDIEVLLTRARSDGIGGWSYFPTLVELPPDADDLAQVMTLFARAGEKELLWERCLLPLDVLLRDCAHADGSFETWLVPDPPATDEQRLQAKWSAEVWGCGGDPEVVANVLHALALLDAARFGDRIARGVEYLARVQAPDGSWPSSWYHGPYYGTYAALRILSRYRAQLQVAAAAVRKGVAFLLRSDSPDDPLNASLAVCGLAAAGALDRSVLERALPLLEATHEADGFWPAVDFIRMDLGRATGTAHQTLTYSSRTITTAFVLKAAVRCTLSGGVHRSDTSRAASSS